MNSGSEANLTQSFIPQFYTKIQASWLTPHSTSSEASPATALLLATGRKSATSATSLARAGKSVGSLVAHSRAFPNNVVGYDSRTVTKTHIPKRHLNFEEPIQGKEFDNTTNRIYGESNQQLMTTNNTEYGTGKNKADGVAKIGRKNAKMEREIERQVMQEMRDRQAAIDARDQDRYFDTTNAENHYEMDNSQNTVGRKVMKTQDGKLVAMGSRDENFIVETGMYRRTAKATDEELRQRIPQGDYTQQRPVSIYTEALERKNTYMSAATGPNPFAKSSGFTQPLNQTRAVTEFEGNVNFEKEKTTVAFARTQGRDLNVRNPYMEKHTQISNFEEIRSKVVELAKKRSANGIRGIRRMFKAMDRNGNGSLSPVEFKYAMRDYGLQLSEIEVTQIVKHFDSNKDG